MLACGASLRVASLRAWLRCFVFCCSCFASCLYWLRARGLLASLRAVASCLRCLLLVASCCFLLRALLLLRFVLLLALFSCLRCFASLACFLLLASCFLLLASLRWLAGWLASLRASNFCLVCGSCWALSIRYLDCLTLLA